jgi:hypothetical protein
MSYNPNTTYIVLQNNIGNQCNSINNDFFYVLTANSTTYYSNSNSFGGFGGFPVFEENGLYTYISQCIIGNTVTSIPVNFIQQSSLVYVSIPSSVTSIGYSAFQNCSNLNTVYIYSNQQITVGSYVFYGIPSTAQLYVTSANINNTNLIQYFAPSNIHLLSPTLTNYNMPNSLNDINNIFLPYTSGATASHTGFVVDNYGGIIGNNLDLAAIFQPYTSGATALPTGFVVDNYGDIPGNNLDLASIFQYVYNGTINNVQDDVVINEDTWVDTSDSSADDSGDWWSGDDYTDID